MKRIGDLCIFVGDKDDIRFGKSKGMYIINAVRKCKGYDCHQSKVGWRGRGCDKQSPHYYYYQDESSLYLNLIDADDLNYIPDEIIDISLKVIHEKVSKGKDVLICCSLGQSRSPSLALMYLLEYKHIDSENCFAIFGENYYPLYNPKIGFLEYIRKRYLVD